MVEALLFFIWNCDDFVYRHPRSATQISFLLLLLGYLGIRPGEAIESTAHLSTNEGLTYGDTELRLVLFRGVHRLQLIIRLGLRKNHRENDAET